jgi:hypothetical protein
MEKLKCGAVVYDNTTKELKTISQQTEEGVLCVWFDKDQYFHREMVDFNKLEPIPS